MDWNSDEGKRLLWAAYPNGVLPTRGVLTIGGWSCIATRPDAAVFRQLHDPFEVWAGVVVTDSASAALIRNGDLLPLPGPNDHATWACLLADMAEACGVSAGEAGLYFLQVAPGEWVLGSRWSYQLCGFDIPTNDPAEALVIARASLRK